MPTVSTRSASPFEERWGRLWKQRALGVIISVWLFWQNFHEFHERAGLREGEGGWGALSPESYDNEIYWCSQYKMRVGERSSQMCQPEARRHDAHKRRQFCSQINIVPDGGFTTCGDFIITATPRLCLRSSSSSTRFMLEAEERHMKAP